jgi:hypothetical protein
MTDAVAIDFETYYDDEVSLVAIPTWRYSFHPKTVPHTVSVFGNGVKFVGPPEQFNWGLLEGRDLIAHNAHFDGLVWKRLVKDKVIPTELKTGRWFDTADMVSYLRLRRALGQVVKTQYGVDLDKGVRTRMKGKTREQMTAEGWREDLDKYALEDAEYTFRLFQDLGPQWPENERRISELNREACWRGVRIDLNAAHKARSHLATVLGTMEQDIPWEFEKTALLHKQIREQARKDGIPCVPSSFAKDSEEFTAWSEEYGPKFAWVRALNGYNRARWMLTKVDTLLNGVDERGIYHYDMKYFGSDTGRFSAGSERGDSGRFSMHGLPRIESFEVDLRGLLIPREGHKFVIYDFSQIEPRLVHWVTGNRALLRKIEAENMSVYQAEAEVCGYGTWKSLKKEDPKLYSFVKAQYLGGQYQCSAAKFRLLAKKQAGMALSEQEAVDIIHRFRSNNPGIPALWRRFQNLISNSAYSKQDLDITLPSGRVLRYYRVHGDSREGGFKAEFRKDDTPYHIYGGLLTNNVIQGTGRDVLCEAILRLDKSEFGAPLWHVHDEGINEVPEDKADPAKVKEIVIDRPSWAKSLPIDSEVVVADKYLK